MKWIDFKEASAADGPDGSTWIVMKHHQEWVAWSTRHGVNMLGFADREAAKASAAERAKRVQ